MAAAVGLVFDDLEGVVGRVSFDPTPNLAVLETVGVALSFWLSGNERKLIAFKNVFTT